MGYTPWLRALVPDINMVTHAVAGTIDRNNAVGVYVKYFSLGNITFTDNSGNTIDNFDPNEFVVQANYAHWFPMGLSVGIAGKYIYSNLTDGLNVGGANTRPGQAGAVDLGLSYRIKREISDISSVGGTFGLGFNNIGSKMSYTSTNEADFLPMNMMIGVQLNTSIEFGKVRFEHDLSYQVTKLLVPTPPRTDDRPSIIADNGDMIPNPNYGQIIAGKDPNVNVMQAIFQSFNDAPGGSLEEWNEVNHQFAHEFRFVLNDFFTVGFREGFFYEHPTKGNRQFVTLGSHIGVAGFRLDAGGIIPIQARHPLENTVFITLGYRMVIGRPTKRMRFPKWDSTKEEMESMELKLDEPKSTE